MQIAAIELDANAGVEQLPLRAFTRIEEDGPAVPAQHVPVVVAIPGRRLRGGPQHDQLSRGGLSFVAERLEHERGHRPSLPGRPRQPSGAMVSGRTARTSTSPFVPSPQSTTWGRPRQLSTANATLPIWAACSSLSTRV